ncbi:MAG: phosphoserine phosphatase SerB [Hellea sp.]|nr:phosphoserine phosphatase SerB [Hellea sp.]
MQFEKMLGVLPTDRIDILSDNKALDYFDNIQSRLHVIVQELEQAGLVFDYSVQLHKNRRKQLLICDMDSTLIGQECINELADFAGVKDHVSEITERAMRGEIGFEGALRERVALLKDLPTSILQTCFDERISLNDGAKTLAQTMAKHGAKTVIVSGGFTFFSERVARDAGFAHHQANILLNDGTLLTGEVENPILGREAKQAALEYHSENVGGPLQAVAIGDGANDLAMIKAAGLGIAYYAKPAVAAAAHCAINHSDLTTALYFQGFKDAEFA